MSEQPEMFLAVIRNRRFKKAFGEIQGEKLLRAPLGYPPDHPMIDHLRHKQFYVGASPDEKECRSPKFVNTVVTVFKDTMPLVRWLIAATQ